MPKSQKRKLKIVAPKPFREHVDCDEHPFGLKLKALHFDECYYPFIWEYYDPRIYWKKHRQDDHHNKYFILYEIDDFVGGGSGEVVYDEYYITRQKKYKHNIIYTRFSKEAQEKWGLKVDPDAIYNPDFCVPPLGVRWDDHFNYPRCQPWR
tara:strand:+ start:72 stop:524 length:453 start_codon:yes stop_codon:yes gene_type:complete